MSGPVQPPLTVETVDGTTSGRPITTIKVTNGDLTISGSTATIDTSGGGGGGGTGTVTSVGSPQAFITITSATTTPSISIGNASGAATGVLTASDFNTFDAKQDAITLTTTGTSGAATFSAGTLNIPQYSGTTGTVTSITAGDGLSGGTITGSGTIAIPAQGGVSAGSYTNTDITVDARGIITAISNGSSGGSGTVTVGTYAGNNNLAYFSDTTEISNTNNISINAAAGTLDCFGNIEAGNVKIGTDTNKNTVETSSAQDLVLRTNGGTNSGTITITDGVNGDISLSPNGTGAVEISGAYKLPTAVTGANDYVLTAQTDGSTAWAAVSGGGSPGGSDTQIQYNNGGSFGGSSVMTFDDTATAEQLLISSSSSTALLKIEQTGAGNAFEVHDATAPDSNRFEIDQYGRASVQGTAGTNSASLYVGGNISTAGRMRGISGTVASPSYASDADTNTGIFFPAADTIGFSNGGTERFRFGLNGELLIGGTVAGTAGQVLTSGGTGTNVTWSDASGGGGLIGVLPQTGSTSENQYNLGTTAPWGMVGNDGTASMATMTQPFAFPFIAPETGTVTAVGLNIVSSASQNAYVAFYSQDSDNLPSTRLGYASVNLGSTGDVYQTTITGTISLTAGTQYWYSINSDVSASATLKAVQLTDGLPGLGIGSALTTNAVTIKDNSATSNAVPPASFTASFVYSSWNRVMVGIKY